MNKTSKKLRIAAMLVAVIMVMCMGASALAASFSARINSAAARVYNVPSSSGTSVKAVKGVKVTVTGYSGSWARISYKGNTGYMPVKYLNLTNRIKAYTGKTTPVYRGASYSSGRMGSLSRGKAVYVVGKSGSYYRVQNASGSVTGYVPSGYLTTKAKLTAAYNAYKKAQAAANNSSSSSSSGSSSSGSTGSSGSSSSGSTATSAIDRVIAKARSYIGRPYAISDNPPSSFNCSSFVKYCMEAYGFSMAGTAAAQAAMSNKVSSLSSVKKGDVLCFDTDDDGTCDHTAISLTAKGTSFIEASENAGEVHINTMTSWYKQHYMWAIRPK